MVLCFVSTHFRHDRGKEKPQYMLFIIWPGLEVVKLAFILRLKIKCNDWLLADTCPQAANHCALFWVWEWTQTCPQVANHCALFWVWEWTQVLITSRPDIATITDHRPTRSSASKTHKIKTSTRQEKDDYSTTTSFLFLSKMITKLERILRTT